MAYRAHVSSLNDIGHQRLLVHCNAKLAFVVVASNGMHTTQVRMRGGKHPEVRKIALVNQILTGRCNDEFLIELAIPWSKA